MADPSKLNFATEELPRAMRHARKAAREAAAKWRRVFNGRGFNESICAIAPHMEAAFDVDAKDRATFLAAVSAAFEEVRDRRRSRAPTLPGIDPATGKDKCPTLGGSQFGRAGR